MIVSFEDIELAVREDEKHEWLIETSLVADGYQVGVNAILNHKSRKVDELIEGKHWLTQNVGGPANKVFWTKKGVVRLGFFIKSKRAKKFRDWAEDFILKKAQPMTQAEIALMHAQNLVNIERRQTEIDNRVQVLEAKTTNTPEFYSVVGYAVLRGMTLSMKESRSLSMKCRSYCKKNNLPIEKIPDPRFGQVNTYHKSVLEEVFNQEYFG